MQKLLLILLFFLFNSQAWAATYYVDKKNGNDSWDGTSATYVSGTTGPWKTLTNPCITSKVASGSDHTINVVAGSGPYYPRDCGGLSLGYLYHQQTAGTITWNWHGNTFQADWNANDPVLYEWHASAGHPGWYYLTAVGGGQPQQNGTVVYGTASALTELFTVIIGDEWNDKATNLVNGAVNATTLSNYAWGNYDSLAFNTLYVSMANGLSPSHSSNISTPIMITDNNGYIFRLDTTTTVHNDLILRGCNDGSSVRALAMIGRPTTFNRVTFLNSRFNGIDTNNALATGSSANFCVFKQCGHRGIQITQAINFNITNCLFDRVHLALKLNNNATYTVTMRNNSSNNLYAGGVQNDNATPTFVEDHNQWHINPSSTHGGKGIAFTASSSYWTTTSPTDIPASTATTNSVGTDPQIDMNGAPLSGSPLIGAGSNTPVTGVISATDILAHPITDSAGNVYYRWVNGVERGSVDIGAYQYVSDPLTIGANGATGGYFNDSHPYVWALPNGGGTIASTGSQSRDAIISVDFAKQRLQVRVTDGIGTTANKTIPIGLSGGGGNFGGSY